MSGPVAGDRGRVPTRIAQVALVVLGAALPLSIAVTEGALILGLVALIAGRLRGRSPTFERSWLEPALLAVAGTWLLSSAFSPEPLASFLHVRKLYAFGLIYLAAEAARDPLVRRRIIAAVLAGAVLGAGAGYVIFAFRAMQQPGYRFQALLSNSMTSGGVLCASALWALGT
ncbi:MAG TPA: hypothetical protein VI792_01605, partial [Candidatus Eisenbacteria bacterium]